MWLEWKMVILLIRFKQKKLKRPLEQPECRGDETVRMIHKNKVLIRYIGWC